MTKQRERTGGKEARGLEYDDWGFGELVPSIAFSAKTNFDLFSFRCCNISVPLHNITIIEAIVTTMVFNRLKESLSTKFSTLLSCPSFRFPH